MLLYLANCIFSCELHFFANICHCQHMQVTLIIHCIDWETPNFIAAKSLYFEKRQIL